MSLVLPVLDSQQVDELEAAFKPTLIVTRFPLGFFSKSSSSLSSPTTASAVGKLSLKNLAPSVRVLIDSNDAKGRKSVKVNDPS
jgi:hypothetical protein